MLGMAERLIFEINEPSAMMVPEIVVAFALGDFGSGPMVVRHFRDFFFDMVKIDGAFVRNLQADSANQAVVAALVSIAKRFEMYCAAEAVLTEAEAAVLRAMGVDCLQGYLYGAPTVRRVRLRDEARRA